MIYITCCLTVVLFFVLCIVKWENSKLATKSRDRLVQITKLIDKLHIAEQEIDESKKREASLISETNTLNRKTKSIEIERDTLQARVSSYAKQIDELTKSLKEAEAKLDFYTNIEEASVNLNEPENSEADQDILERAIHQIQVARMQFESDSNNSNYADTVGTPLDKEQFSACIEMENSQDSFFITGKAGTGKSLLLNVFRKTTKKAHIVLAPTGIAALNVGGATIHSIFGYNNLTALNIDNITSDTIRLSGEKRMILKLVSTIIIDEISMVRVDVLERIDLILKAVNNNDLPFGGKQMLIFGDLFQLPPISTKPERDYLSDRYGGIHFFLFKCIQKRQISFF